MMIRTTVGIVISFFMIEILLRAFFQLPHLAAYNFDVKTGIIFFKPDITNKKISTRQNFSFRKNSNTNSLPLFFDLTTDSFSSRSGSQKLENFDSYHLLLGDSIALGWPVSFTESPLNLLNQNLSEPVFSCAFLASGPVQIEKMLKTKHCLRPQKLKSAVIQITVHQHFGFPDSLFVDSAGENFQPLLIYLTNESSAFDQEFDFSSSELMKATLNFNDQFFNHYLPALEKSHLAKTVYLISRKPPKDVFFKITNWVNSTVAHDQRHQKTLTAILNIEKILGFKPKIFISRTKESMQQPIERPEITRLKAELSKNNFHVFDMITHKNRTAMPSQYYYMNDLHPNSEGYKLIADEMLNLFK